MAIETNKGSSGDNLGDAGYLADKYRQQYAAGGGGTGKGGTGKGGSGTGKGGGGTGKRRGGTGKRY